MTKYSKAEWLLDATEAGLHCFFEPVDQIDEGVPLKRIGRASLQFGHETYFVLQTGKIFDSKLDSIVVSIELQSSRVSPYLGNVLCLLLCILRMFNSYVRST